MYLYIRLQYFDNEISFCVLFFRGRAETGNVIVNQYYVAGWYNINKRKNMKKQFN